MGGGDRTPVTVTVTPSTNRVLVGEKVQLVAKVLDAGGNLESIVTVEVKWQRNDQGVVVPVEVPGTEQVRPAQLALLAMGFLGPEQSLLKDIGVACDARSNVQAEYGRYATSVKGVFTAGDCRRGQSLVVWAINEGRGAAAACDRFLSGK